MWLVHALTRVTIPQVVSRERNDAQQQLQVAQHEAEAAQSARRDAEERVNARQSELQQKQKEVDDLQRELSQVGNARHVAHVVLAIAPRVSG